MKTAAPMYHEETVSTLKFGQLCKAIKNKPKSNSTVDDKILLKQYRGTIVALREQIDGKEAMLREAKAEVTEVKKKLEESEADANPILQPDTAAHARPPLPSKFLDVAIDRLPHGLPT